MMRASQFTAAAKPAQMARLVNLALVVCLCGCALLGSAGRAAAAMVYVAGSGNEFGTLDLTTGAFTQIGTLNLPAGDNLFGMGFGADGNLYGLDSSTPNAELYRINITTAQVTAIGALGHSAIDATADASGKMYAISQDANGLFYTLSPPSTTTTDVGSIGIHSSGLAAVTADGSQLFTSATDPVTGDADLYSVNQATGLATEIGDTGFFIINGLFVNGTLYGFDDVTDAIVTINTTTGAATQVATYSLPGGDVIFASATTPGNIGTVVPEPMSLTLLGLGVAGVAAYGWRRKPAR
jgi:hypothetical protein